MLFSALWHGQDADVPHTFYLTAQRDSNRLVTSHIIQSTTSLQVRNIIFFCFLINLNTRSITKHPQFH